MKPKVFVTRKLPESAAQRLNQVCQADIWQGKLPPPKVEIIQRTKGRDGLLCLLTDPIDREALDGIGSSLKVISNCAVGYDNIDIEEATRRGIPVGNTPGILTDTTADFAFGLLMSAARRVVEADRYVRGGKWQTWELTLLLGKDIHNATIGIVGFGRIGQAVARRAAGFGMQILYHDPGMKTDPAAAELGATYVDLDELFRRSDFVSLHVPLNDETHHLIDQVALEKMKKEAILINTSRGGVVDTDALYQALVQGQIAYAALDVTEPEPIPVNHPILARDNVILAPHIASASRETRGRMALMAVENLVAGLEGQPLPNCVNPQVYNRD